MLTISTEDPLARALAGAIQAGDLASLRRLMSENDGLASASIQDHKGSLRTLLHVATDWPGYFPNGPAVVELLISAGADPNAPINGGNHAETPLHWAASSDDVDVADALIDGGADLEAPGASIAGGPPLDDAVGYGCWNVARRLVERGARVDVLWHAAALGQLARVEELVGAVPAPSPEELNDAFWQACHGGQRRVAEYLLAQGADLNWIPDHTDMTPMDVASNPGTRRDTLTAWLRDQHARSAREQP